MKKRGIISLTACLTLCLCLAGNVYGAEKEGPSNSYVQLKETYNREMGLYEEQFAGGRRFITNIPNGGQMYDAAYIALGGNMNGTLERDGVRMPLSNDGFLYEPGYYILTIEAPTVGKTMNETAVFSFRLLGQPAGLADTGEYPHPKIACGTDVVSDTEKDGWYHYTLPNYKSFFSTVSKDNSTVETACFYIPGNVGCVLTRDGAPVQLINRVELDTPGQYSLKIFAESYGSANPCPVYYESFLSFTIPVKESDNTAGAIGSAVSSAFSGGGNGGSDTKDSKRQVLVENLSENYYENAGLYEEAFSNGVVFYSNVAAGSISGGNVYLDIPANVQISMTKDGVAATFLNKIPINEEGSYLLNLSVSDVKDGITEVRDSSMRFRIQKGVAPALSPDAAAQLSSAVNTEEMLPESTVESTTDLPEANEANASGTDVNGQDNIDNKMYDKEKEMYRYLFPDGTEIYLNVPTNTMVNEAVYAELPTGVKATVTKDGAATVDYQSGMQAIDHGSYVIAAENEAGEKIELPFRILLHAVNDVTQFTAPEGYIISSVDIDGDQATQLNAASYDLTEDGTYSFIMSGKSKDFPELFTVVIKDTQAPELTFEGLDENGKAIAKSFSYTCDDENAVITVLRGKKTVRTIGNTLTDSGNYTISVEDAAGNRNEYHSKISFHLNMITIILCAIVIVIIGGLIAFYISNREQMKVR